MESTFWLTAIAIIGLAVWGIKVYNQLQNYMQSIRQYLSNLQAALKKRIDLTNQIVDIAASSLKNATVGKTNEAPKTANEPSNKNNQNPLT